MKRGNTKRVSKHPNVCRYCDVAFEPDDAVCGDATSARSCFFNQPLTFKPKVVGPDFERIEDNQMRLKAMQQLINSGAAWQPQICTDGHIGREANDLIARGLCKVPRSNAARAMRAMFAL